MWERDCFSNLFFGKQPIENKFYFYNSSSLTKDIFPMAIFFFFMLSNTKKYEKLYL